MSWYPKVYLVHPALYNYLVSSDVEPTSSQLRHIRQFNNASLERVGEVVSSQAPPDHMQGDGGGPVKLHSCDNVGVRGHVSDPR